jgi:hypothetical protein
VVSRTFWIPDQARNDGKRTYSKVSDHTGSMDIYYEIIQIADNFFAYKKRSPRDRPVLLNSDSASAFERYSVD